MRAWQARIPIRNDERRNLNENWMKDLPLWPFLALRTIVESVSSEESVTDWGTNPPPTKKFFYFSNFSIPRNDPN
jgi:hypothetical protein